MGKYAVKATVWLQIDDDSDAMCDAQFTVRGLVDLIKNCDDTYVSIAHVTDMEFHPPALREEMTECDNALYLNEHCLDDGMR